MGRAGQPGELPSVHLPFGLGGTANQLCAGLGIPVVSIDEKGKRVQKKLLGGAEILVKATPEALADCALRVLGDPELFARMSAAGRRRMGAPGALADVVEYAASAPGWEVREALYERLRGRDGMPGENQAKISVPRASRNAS